MNEISIIIVEDEAVTAMYMGKIFSRRGYNVLACVSTGEEAIESVAALKPDLVILDIRLAGSMDGIETAELIMKTSRYNVQIIFLTGYSDPELMERAMKVHPLYFFLKPLNLPEFIRIVESFYSDK